MLEYIDTKSCIVNHLQLPYPFDAKTGTLRVILNQDCFNGINIASLMWTYM